MLSALFLLVLLSYCSGVAPQPTLTQPPTLSVPLAQTVKLSCIVSSNMNTIFWQQQRAGQAPRFVHCNGCSSRGAGIPNRFTASASGNTGYLTITNVDAEDEADYYCGMWYSNTYTVMKSAGELRQKPSLSLLRVGSLSSSNSFV